MDNIRFIKEVDEARVADELACYLNKLLVSQKVLWLVPGGSAAKVAAVASQRVQAAGNLIVSLTDERYGPPGNPDSNWRLLEELDFLFPAGSYRVLTGQNSEKEVKSFNNFLAVALKSKAHLVASFGMGKDGHISGLLPHSSALASPDLAAFYNGPDFKRITTTPKFIAEIDQAFVYAKGQEKHHQIKKLSRSIDVSEQPAQLLKGLPRVTFFNDYLDTH